MASVHLLVLIHGMWGHPGHLAEMDRIIQERVVTESSDGIELKVLLAETNRDDATYDGVDWGGERVAQEVTDEVKKLENEGHKVTRFSVTGYSLGGLVARYLVGILYQRDFFADVKPVNFTTVATPHLGLPTSPELFSTVKAALGPKLLSRTGEQFYCVDRWSNTGKPLLEVMADPHGIFYQTLLKFAHLTIYANAINDITVPYLTSAIETEDPFADHLTKGIEIEFLEDYAPLIKSYTIPTSPPAKPTVLSPDWFRGLKSDRPLLPPALQFRCPLNILAYMFLPVLIPVGVSVAVVRLSWASYNSRARIKLLEKDESYHKKLVHVLANLEKEVEDVVVDLIDDPIPESDANSLETTAESSSSNILPGAQVSRKPQILSPLQLRMAASLNALPHLRKEVAFIERVRNSHAPIVSRDVKRFPFHRVGEGVIRHWADHFEL